MNMLLTEVVEGFKFSAYLRLSAHLVDFRWSSSACSDLVFRKTRDMNVTCGLIVKYPQKTSTYGHPAHAHIQCPPPVTAQRRGRWESSSPVELVWQSFTLLRKLLLYKNTWHESTKETIALKIDCFPIRTLTSQPRMHPFQYKEKRKKFADISSQQSLNSTV